MLSHHLGAPWEDHGLGAMGLKGAEAGGYQLATFLASQLTGKFFYWWEIQVSHLHGCHDNPVYRDCYTSSKGSLLDHVTLLHALAVDLFYFALKFRTQTKRADTIWSIVNSYGRSIALVGFTLIGAHNSLAKMGHMVPPNNKGVGSSILPCVWKVKSLKGATPMTTTVNKLVNSPKSPLHST